MFILAVGIYSTKSFPLGICDLVIVPNRETFLGSQEQKFNQGYAINRSTVFTTYVAYPYPLKIWQAHILP